MSRAIPREELRRKLIHIGSAAIPLTYALIDRQLGIVLLALLVAGMLAAEWVRMRTEIGRRYYGKLFGSMTRASEAKRFTGATFLLIGMLLSALLFPQDIAMLGMLFLSWGDSAAALVGLRWGHVRIGSKTLEGSLACLTVCLVTGLAFGLPLITAITAAAVATVVEALDIPFINDNIAIPLASSAAILLTLNSAI